MNVITLYGRLTKDVEIKSTQLNKQYAIFTVAVQRTYKDQSGNYNSDFINCVAFNEHIVNLLSKYVKKGSRISVNGTLQINSSTKDDGSYSNFTQVIVDKVSLIDTLAETQGNPNQAQSQTTQRPQQQKQQAQQVQEFVGEDDLPF